MRLKKFLLFLTIIITSFLNINYSYSIEPDVFVQSTVNRASQILSKNISKEEKMKQLEIIAKETVDIIGIGYYSLGPKRKELDENQKKLITNAGYCSNKRNKLNKLSKSTALHSTLIIEDYSSCSSKKINKRL